MVVTNEAINFTGIHHWSEVFANLYARIAHRFGRSEVRERARRYIIGLLGKVERKNGWQLAEEIGEHDPQGVQRLLNAARWDAGPASGYPVRDDLRDYVVTQIGDETSGILIVDETGFLKKGTKSCGAAFIDRALSLPQEWIADTARRNEAGIPPDIGFTTKIVLAQQLLERAFAVAVPARWVVADSFYGRSHAFRRWLEQHNQAYVTMIPESNAVQYRGQREWAEQLGSRLTEEMWIPLSSGPGSLGERIHAWACLDLSEPSPDGVARWLLIRRDPEQSSAHTYWLAYGPEETTPTELVRVADGRWQVEECFAQAKGEVGLDHYEVRTWKAWYRFVTLALLAHAFLVVLRLHAADEATERNPGDDSLDLIPLTVPEVLRIMIALGEAPERRRFRLAWSRWRRAHQAVAARYHALRQIRRRDHPANGQINLPPT